MVPLFKQLLKFGNRVVRELEMVGVLDSSFLSDTLKEKLKSLIEERLSRLE